MVVEIVWDLTHLSQVGLPLLGHCSEDGVLCVVVHVLHEYSLFESMKLPRLLLLFVLLLRPLPLKKDRLGLELYVLSFRPAAPPRQNKTVRDEEASHSCPFEAESVFADVRGLSIVAEIVSALDVRSTGE